MMPSRDGPTVSVLGLPFAAVNEAEAVERIFAAIALQRGQWIVTANLDHLRRYRSEDAAKRLIEQADMIVADGMPIFWACRIAGLPLPTRVAGSDLIWSLAGRARDCNSSIYLLGGAPGAAKEAESILITQFPGLRIVGVHCPPPGFEQDKRTIDAMQRELQQLQPDLVLVALGFPKQDQLISRLKKGMPQSTFIGVGISLSFITGEVRRAPQWAQSLGLEWVHRMLQDPQRLFRRYVLQGMPFALRLLSLAARHRLVGSLRGLMHHEGSASGYR